MPPPKFPTNKKWNQQESLCPPSLPFLKVLLSCFFSLTGKASPKAQKTSWWVRGYTNQNHAFFEWLFTLSSLNTSSVCMERGEKEREWESQFYFIFSSQGKGQDPQASLEQGILRTYFSPFGMETCKERKRKFWRLLLKCLRNPLQLEWLAIQYILGCVQSYLKEDPLKLIGSEVIAMSIKSNGSVLSRTSTEYHPLMQEYMDNDNEMGGEGMENYGSFCWNTVSSWREGGYLLSSFLLLASLTSTYSEADCL